MEQLAADPNFTTLECARTRAYPQCSVCQPCSEGKQKRDKNCCISKEKADISPHFLLSFLFSSFGSGAFRRSTSGLRSPSQTAPVFMLRRRRARKIHKKKHSFSQQARLAIEAPLRGGLCPSVSGHEVSLASPGFHCW